MLIGKRTIHGRWLTIKLEEAPGMPDWVTGLAEVRGERRMLLIRQLPITIMADPGVRQAWEWRAEANLAMRCPSCENEADRSSPRAGEDGMPHAPLAHEHYCPVSDENFAALVRKARGLR